MLIVVVYIALKSGPSTGLLAGTVAGLIQDALSSGVLGIGGLAKTIVGFLSGVLGTQFIVTGAVAAVPVADAGHGAARRHLHGALHAAEPAAVSRRRYPSVVGASPWQCALLGWWRFS